MNTLFAPPKTTVPRLATEHTLLARFFAESLVRHQHGTVTLAAVEALMEHLLPLATQSMIAWPAHPMEDVEWLVTHLTPSQSLEPLSFGPDGLAARQYAGTCTRSYIDHIFHWRWKDTPCNI